MEEREGELLLLDFVAGLAKLLRHIGGRCVVAGCPGGPGAVVLIGDPLERPLVLQNAADGNGLAELLRIDVVYGERLDW